MIMYVRASAKNRTGCYTCSGLPPLPQARLSIGPAAYLFLPQALSCIGPAEPKRGARAKTGIPAGQRVKGLAAARLGDGLALGRSARG